MLSSNDTISSVLNQKINNDTFFQAEKELFLLAKEYENIWNDIINQNLIFENDTLNNNEGLFNNFVADTKYIFRLMYKLYACPDFVQEINDALNSDNEDEYSKQEMHRFNEFINNIKFIIDTEPIIFKEKNSNVYNIIDQCSLYINKKNKDMQDLTNTMKEMNNTLKVLSEAITTSLDKKLA